MIITDNLIQERSILTIELLLLLFLVEFIKYYSVNWMPYSLILISCSALLYAGVTKPMIEINARISDFHFLLMGEPMEFSNQILFSQIKSILEVVHIIISTYEYQSVAVGIYIFLLSIIFPLAKISVTMAIVSNSRAYHNKIMKSLAMHTGK